MDCTDNLFFVRRNVLPHTAQLEYAVYIGGIFFEMGNEEPGQTEQLRRLVRVFVGCICYKAFFSHFITFVIMLPKTCKLHVG